MKYPLVVQRTVLIVASCTFLQHGGVVQAAQDDGAPVAGKRPAMNALTPEPVADALRGVASGTLPASSVASAGSDAQGDVGDLMQRIHDAKLSELRTTYNGNYGASLFFYPQEVTYYVALFQDKHFWRVIRTDDASRAEAIYAGFVQQTSQLAEVEIRRTQLQAQKVYIENIIALSEDRAQRLQADLDVARTQQAKVNEYQRQTQGEAAALHAEKDRAQAQLRQVQNEVMQLQRQTELGLPVQK
ncbi:MAG TPA: DUF2968 domain-containing protein [Paraburkholderia sp.]|jgi:hypothetical protein|nr:DUF2968 domain-containing protein [Paraburkholderia sp.]